MIRYLQRLKAKKGFTVVELIVVIAIIAVLTAVILSNAGVENEKIQAANNVARDFYSTVQYSFTKYMKYESDLSLEIKGETGTNASKNFIQYWAELNGNYPVNTTTFIKMFVDKNQIKYVQTFSSLKDMLSESTTDARNAFDRLMMSDFDTVMESNVDGYYYALVTFDKASNSATVKPTGAAPVKVHSAYYCARPFIQVSGGTDTTEYVINNLTFKKYGVLSNDEICGVCTSATYTIEGKKVYLGDEETYFMGTDSHLEALKFTPSIPTT